MDFSNSTGFESDITDPSTGKKYCSFDFLSEPRLLLPYMPPPNCDRKDIVDFRDSIADILLVPHSKKGLALTLILCNYHNVIMYPLEDKKVERL